MIAKNAEQEKAQKQVVQLASDMLAGSLSYIAGARALMALRSQVGAADDDVDFSRFAAIVSETDAFPIDTGIQKLWQLNALRKLDPEIARAESWARNFGEAHCRNIVTRYSSKVFPSS